MIGREGFSFAQTNENEARRGHALAGIEYGGLVAFAAEVAACNEVGNKPVQCAIGGTCCAAWFCDAFKEVEYDGVCCTFEDVADGDGDVHGENWSYMRNGLMRFSRSMVVSGPCPG